MIETDKHHINGSQGTLSNRIKDGVATREDAGGFPEDEWLV